MVDGHSERTVHAVRSLVQQRRRLDRLLVLLPPEGVPGPFREELTGLAADAAVELQLIDTAPDAGPVAHGGMTAAGPTAELLARLTEAVPGEAAADAPATGRDHWLWMLPSGYRADPSALEHLLAVVGTSPSVTVAGCKLVQADQPRHLVAVGLTVTPTAEPVALIEPGELDQGQYDARSDVLAVPSPGLLIRRDVWADLGGPDALTPDAALATDLCWRNRLAGHRVVVVPQALVHQSVPAGPAREGADGLAGMDRPDAAGPGPVASSSRERAEVGKLREAAVWLRLKHAAAPAVPVLWLWSLLTALGGFVLALLAKEPGVGGARLSGTLRTLVRPRALARSRRQAAATRSTARSAVAPLRAPGHQVRAYRRSVVDLDAPDEVIGDGTGGTSQTAEPTGGHDDFTALAAPERNWVGLGLVAALVVLGGLSLVGWSQLLAAPAVTGGSMLPISSSVEALWRHTTSGWSAAGVGAPAQAGPFGLLLALLGSTGHGSAVLVWLTVLSMPLAAAGAWAVAGAVDRNRGGRLLMALLWGLSPALLAAAGAGRPGALLVHVLLPWLALAVIRAVGVAARHRLDPRGTPVDGHSRPGHRGAVSWTASGWTVLLLAALGAAAPALLPVLILGVWLAAAASRRRGRTLWWTPLPALALFLPVLAAHGTDLRALLADPGLPQAAEAAPLWQQLLGFPVAFTADAGLTALPWLDSLAAGLPWALIAALVVGVPLLLLAAVGGFASGRSGGLARSGEVLTALALVGSWIAGGLVTAVDTTGQAVTVYTGTFTSTALLGLLLSAQAAFGALRERRGAGRTSGRTATTVLAVAAAGSVVLSGVLWMVPRTVEPAQLQDAADHAVLARTADGEQQAVLEQGGTATTVRGTDERGVPATAADQGLGPLATRTVVIERTEEGLGVSLVSGAGPALDRLSAAWTSRAVTGPLSAPQASGPDPADEQLRTLAAQLTAGTAVDPRPVLHSFGASFVVLRDPSGSEQSTAASIDAVPGLDTVGLTDSGWLWRATPADGGAPVPAAVGDHGRQGGQGLFTSRARVEGADGTVQQLLPVDAGRVQTDVPEAEGDAERRVVLAERAAPGWRATMDGEPLESMSRASRSGADEAQAAARPGAWAQQFELPERGGELAVWYDSGVPTGLWWIGWILLGIAVLLAIPTPARRVSGAGASERPGPGSRGGSSQVSVRSAPAADPAPVTDPVPMADPAPVPTPVDASGTVETVDALDSIAERTSRP